MRINEIARGATIYRPPTAALLAGLVLILSTPFAAGQVIESAAAAPDPQAASGASSPLNAVLNSLISPLRSGADGQPAADPLPSPDSPSPDQFRIPLSGGDPSSDIRVKNQGRGITLMARNAKLRDVVSRLAETEGINIVCGSDVDATISITLHNVALEEALDSIVSVAGYTWARDRNIIHITSVLNAVRLAPHVQGRQIKVFRLDYASAVDLDSAIKGMLSPVGNSYVMGSSPTDNRKATESIVVEDLPAYLPRIERYIAQMDQPPRQVLVEVHVLQVELKDDNRHGVNFRHLMKMADKDFKLQMAGFASATAPQAFFAEISGGNLTALLEALKSTTDAKTLASPRVLVLNGQLSRIQVGEKVGFRVTTVTETSTVESVDFLDVGVVLEVTPQISRDNHVLMQIKPKVSTGAINPDTGLPEEATSEFETAVLLRDGQGVVIGGLIQEKDSNVQSKLPHLGDVKWLGPLFQRREVEKARSEILFFLLPRVTPYPEHVQALADIDAARAQTPLLHGCLERVPRPWECRLPDAFDNSVSWRRAPHGCRVWGHDQGCDCAGGKGPPLAEPLYDTDPLPPPVDVSASGRSSLYRLPLVVRPATAGDTRASVRRLPPAAARTLR